MRVVSDNRGCRPKKRLTDAVDWLLDVGTFNCERQDCPGGGRPCSLCSMPELDERTAAKMLLFQRCRERGCLPYPGALMNQPDAVMRDFDAVDERIAEHKRREREDEAGADLTERLKGGTVGQRRN